MSFPLPQLRILIPTALALWAISCVIVHGPTLLAYIGLQAITTGVFALAMYRTERIAIRRPQEEPVVVPRKTRTLPTRRGTATSVVVK